MEKLNVGFAFCGSFCTLSKAVSALQALKSPEIEITPIFSEIVWNTDTRFYKALDLREQVESICGKEIIHDIPSAEPIGPKNLLDAIVVCPCTGNTAAKIALGITDTSVTMAVKATLRNQKPVVIAVASNDALGAGGGNIGRLHNTRGIYMVPYRQDDPAGKTTSLVCDFKAVPETLFAALEGRQLQPVVRELMK